MQRHSNSTFKLTMYIYILTCILTMVSSARNFTEDLMPITSSFLGGSLDLNNIEDLPIDPELKEIAMQYYDYKMEYYLTLVREDLTDDYESDFNRTISTEIKLMLPSTYSDALRKNTETKVKEIRNKEEVKALEKSALEGIYDKHKNEIDNLPEETKNYFRDEIYGGDTTVDTMYDAGMKIYGKNITQKLESHVKNVISQEITAFSKAIASDLWLIAINELEDSSKAIVYITNGQVSLNKEQFVLWNMQMELTLNLTTNVNDDFNFIKPPIIQEFSLLSSNNDNINNNNKLCTIKYEKKFFNQATNTLNLNFTLGCIDYLDISNPYFIIMSLSKVGKFVLPYTKAYYFSEQLFTIIDDTKLNNENIISNLRKTESNTWMLLSLITLEPEYQHDVLILEYSFDKVEYHSVSLDLSNQYSTTLARDVDESINLILYNSNHQIILAQQNILLKSAGDTIEMFASRYALFNVDDMYHYITCSFSKDVYDKVINIYFNNEFIGKKELNVNELTIRLPKKNNDNTLVMFSFERDGIIYPGFSIYQGNVNGIEMNVIENFLSKYANTIRDYTGLLLSSNQIEKFQGYINVFKKSLENDATTVLEQIQTLLLGSVGEVINDVIYSMEDKCRNNESIEIDYAILNKVMNMIDSSVNRNDILSGLQSVLSEMLSETVNNVNDKIIETISLKLSQGFYIYADYTLPVRLLQLIQKEINIAMRKACDLLSSDHKPITIVNDEYVEFKQKEIVEWYTSEITLILRDGQTSFEEFTEYTIGLTRKNGVTMYCQTAFTYLSSQSETVLSFPANCLTYIENEIIPESNVYVLSYMTSTSDIKVNLNATITVIKHKLCPNPFKHLISSNNVVYVFDSFELYDTSNEVVIIEHNSNAITKTPQYGQTFKVIVYSAEAGVVYANENVLYIEDILATPETNIILPSNTNTIKVELKTNEHVVTSSTTTPIVVYMEQTQLITSQYQGGSTVVINLPLDDVTNYNSNNGQVNVYIEYHDYKTKSFTLYFSDYLSQIQNTEYTYRIFDVLYTWISPCLDTEISFTEIETTTTPHLTHLTESLMQFTATYDISINESYYQSIIEQSLQDIFIKVNEDESWRGIVDDDDYPREQFLLDKVMELFTSEQIHSTLLQYIHVLLTDNNDVSTILTSFKTDLLNELVTTVNVNEMHHYKYKSLIETTIKDISVIYAQKILFIYLEQKYIDKLRSFTNTFVLDLYNAITSTKRLQIQITSQSLQTNKRDLIPWNMLIHLQITDTSLLNIQTNMNVNFLLLDTANNNDHCVTSVTITNPSYIQIPFPNNCITYQPTTSNTYLLGYKVSTTWLDIPIEKVYEFTSINIELTDPSKLSKPTSDIFTNYKLYPSNEYHFLNAPKQNPNANVFCEYKSNVTDDNTFHSSPPSTIRAAISYVVYDNNTKRVLHAEQDIIMISHELTLLNPTVIFSSSTPSLIGFSFDSDVSTYGLENGIFIGTSQVNGCRLKTNTIIECEIKFATTRTYKFHGRSDTAYTNYIPITIIKETEVWDPTQIEVCQYGLQPKQVILSGSNTSLINNLSAALISSRSEIITLTKHENEITFPIINTFDVYTLSLYEVDPFYNVANTSIKFVTPYIDIKNKHLQVEGKQNEKIAIGGIICAIEGLRLINVNTDVSSEIICNENTENEEVFICSVNTPISEGQYNLYNGDLIFDTFDATIPFMKGNFNFVSDSLCLVTSSVHANVFEITSLNYPMKYIDGVIFRSLSSNITASIQLSEDNSTLLSSVLFEIEGKYQPVLVYNGEELVMDVVVNPSSNLFALENKYVVLPYASYGIESVVDIEVTLLFNYGEATRIVFNNGVECVVEEVGKCRITYTVDKPIDIQLSIPCSESTSSEIETFYVFYFKNDYSESEMKCISKGKESKEKYFTLFSESGIGEHELYIYIEDANGVVSEKRIPSNNVKENRINSFEMLSKLTEGMYSIKVGNEKVKYEMNDINIEKLITIKSIGDKLLAGFPSQTIDIELTETSNENKIKAITVKPLNNDNDNVLTITCSFVSEVLLQCNNIDLSNIPQGKTVFTITNICGDSTQKQIELSWTTINSISPPSIDYNNNEQQNENTFTITFTDTLPSSITEITVDFIDKKTNKPNLTTQFTLTPDSTYTSTISSSSLPGALYKVKASYKDYSTTYPINNNDYYDIIPKCDDGYVYEPSIHECIATMATNCDACDKRGTASCKSINSIFYCTCNHNYYGVLCDEHITNASNDYNNLIHQLEFQGEISQMQVNIINKLIILTSSYQDTLSQQELPINEINSLRDHTINILHQQSAKYNDMLNLVTLSIKNEILKLKRLRQHKRKMRLLSEVNETEDEIKRTINTLLMSTADYFTNQATEVQSLSQNINESLLTYTNTHLLVQTWFSNYESKQHAKNNATDLNLTWIESIPCLDNTNNNQYVFSKVEMFSETSSDIYESTQSNIIAFKAKQIETNSNNIALVNWNHLHCDNNSMIITVPINSANVNETRYNKAAEIGVKMYDSNSQIYSDSCFRKHSLPYDITAKERENILGDIKVINPLYNTCMFDTIDFNASKVVLNCVFDNNNTKDDNIIVGYSYEDYPKEVKYDSVFECSGDIEHIEKNVGLYISIAVLILILMVQIVCGIAKNKKNLIIEDHINSALVNDGIEERKMLNKTIRTAANQKTDCNIQTNSMYCNQKNNNNTNAPTQPEKVQLQAPANYELERVPSFVMFKIKKGKRDNPEDKPVTNPKDSVQINTNINLDIKDTAPEILDENQIDIQINSFGNVFCKNFFELCPFINTCHASIITPFFMRSAFNMFSIIILLGFNACYYTNAYLNKRIKHSNRDAFIYPLTHDITRIISVIVSSMILTVIMRLIVLVTYKRKEDLATEIKVCQNNTEPIKKFTDEMFVRRLIVQLLMSIITLFVFYFIFAFCNRYPKAQYSWAISFVWSIIFTYVPLSLIYILIVSIVETNNKCNSCVYYAKRVFMF